MSPTNATYMELQRVRLCPSSLDGRVVLAGIHTRRNIIGSSPQQVNILSYEMSEIYPYEACLTEIKIALPYR